MKEKYFNMMEILADYYEKDTVLSNNEVMSALDIQNELNDIFSSFKRVFDCKKTKNRMSKMLSKKFDRNLVMDKIIFDINELGEPVITFVVNTDKDYVATSFSLVKKNNGDIKYICKFGYSFDTNAVYIKTIYFDIKELFYKYEKIVPLFQRVLNYKKEVCEGEGEFLSFSFFNIIRFEDDNFNISFNCWDTKLFADMRMKNDSNSVSEMMNIDNITIRDLIYENKDLILSTIPVDKKKINPKLSDIIDYSKKMKNNLKHDKMKKSLGGILKNGKLG